MTTRIQIESAAAEPMYFDFRFSQVDCSAIEESLQTFRATAMERANALRLELRELVSRRFVKSSLWANYVVSDWDAEFRELFDWTVDLGLVDEAQIFCAVWFSESDSYCAYHYLLLRVRTAIEAEICRLTSLGYKRKSSPNAGVFLNVQHSDLLHGLISLQREWFLHHGSHPSRTSLNRVRGGKGVSTYSS